VKKCVELRKPVEVGGAAVLDRRPSFSRISQPGSQYNPRMASAPSPERPVVLRRLGIMKEPDEPRLQDSRTQRDAKQQDALELFATETDSSSSLQQWLSAAGASGAAAARAALRSPMVGIVLVAALAFAGSIWGINRYFASSGTPAEGETVGAGADGAESPASADASASTSTQSTKRAGSVNATSGRAGSTIARARQTVASAREDVAVPPFAAATNTAPADLLNGTAASVGAVDAPAEASSVADEASAGIDETIYSAQDRDVIPPQTSEPLPAPTFSGAWTTRTNSMEVIVSETGTVERVRMLTPPQRMPDVLELSRAKVWKFTPAMKDGRPVRYRLLLKWEVNP
jgi:hypothetical protein